MIALKASVSATFEKGLAPVMERVSKLLPQFESGFNHVANAVVGVADGVVGFFEGEEAMNQFNNVHGAHQGSVPRHSTVLQRLLVGPDDPDLWRR